MTKHKRNKCIEYNYDYVFNEELEREAVNPIFLSNMLRNNKYSIYATKEILAGSQFEVEIYPEFLSKKDMPKEYVHKKKNKKAQDNLNDKNARKNVERIINLNFGKNDIWVTLTYPKGREPNDFTEAINNMQNYIKRINYRRKKLGLGKARYVYITEHEPSAKIRWHHHLVMDGDLDSSIVESVWNKNSRNQVRKLEPDEYGLIGVAKYITKQKEKGRKRWNSSTGLIKPKPKKNHYKFKYKDVKKMVENQNVIEEMLKERYPTMMFTKATVYHNNFNGHWYIYARLRLQL